MPNQAWSRPADARSAAQGVPQQVGGRHQPTAGGPGPDLGPTGVIAPDVVGVPTSTGVGPPHHLVQGPHRFNPGALDRGANLVAVPDAPSRGDVRHLVLVVDLHHLCAEVGNRHARYRAGQPRRELHHPQALKGSCLLRGRRLRGGHLSAGPDDHRDPQPMNNRPGHRRPARPLRSAPRWATLTNFVYRASIWPDAASRRPSPHRRVSARDRHSRKSPSQPTTRADAPLTCQPSHPGRHRRAPHHGFAGDPVAECPGDG